MAFALALSGSAAAAAPGNELGNIGEAVDPVEALGLGSLSGFYLAARHARFNQDLTAAAGFYVSALAKDRANTDLLDTSLILNVASGNISRSVTLAEQLLRSEPDNWIALTTLAVDQIRNGERGAAMETLGNLDEVGGQIQELVAGLLEAWITVAKNDTDGALAHLEELSGPRQYEPSTTLHTGLIADFAGRNDVAGEALEASFKRDAGSPRVVEAYVRALARAGNLDRANEILDEFEERLGGNDQFTASLREAIAAGDVAPLIDTPMKGAAEALYGLGTAYARDGGNAQAAALFQLALYLDPESYFAAMALGQVMESLQQYEAAIEIYRRIPDGHALSRTARVQEALNLNALERNAEAISLLSTAVEQDPTDVPTTVVLGNVYRDMENYDQARQTYSKAIDALGDVPPAYWTLYYFRGIARERTNEWDGAERDFRLALTYRPDNAHTLNYLGYSLIDRGEKLSEAIGMVRRAVAAEPSNGYIVDSLGWAYYRLGRYQDAVRELERAVNLKPIDPVINDHLGDAYWQVGRKREAMFQWAHARDFDPDPELTASIAKKLAEGLGPQTPVQQEASNKHAAPAEGTGEASIKVEIAPEPSEADTGGENAPKE
ncbi:tetratricopeptide repeat protein [Acuticoccus sp. I52.16.1]|uniref:tetratricopeptide repeat protein n=1 Tax=Acuticoccus sp. I52.16.1 TaxID=2928472 RepID=UPI001FD12E1B|nr:tetratricopeptide repeat protein [Acuticoccus sp. I52.16.1]UOM35713.1 tetratricopeptide repeat protein [Acuticoccus sp. I52.16.1]